MDLKENILYFAPFIFELFAILLLVNGIFNPLLKYALDIGEVKDTIYLGSTMVEGILIIIVSAIFLYLLIKSVRNPIFNIENKVIEFVLYWIFAMLFISLFVVISYLVPDFGYLITISIYNQILLGLIFAISGYTLYKINN